MSDDELGVLEDLIFQVIEVFCEQVVCQGLVESDEEVVQIFGLCFVVDIECKYMCIFEVLLFVVVELLDEEMLIGCLLMEVNILFLLKMLQEDYVECGVCLVEVGGCWCFEIVLDLVDVFNEVCQELCKLL